MPCGVRERERCCCCCPCLRESASNSSVIAPLFFFSFEQFCSIFSSEVRLFFRPLLLFLPEAIDLFSRAPHGSFLPLRLHLQDGRRARPGSLPERTSPRDAKRGGRRERRGGGARAAMAPAPTACSSPRRRRPEPSSNLFLLLLFLRPLPPPSPRARGCTGSTRTGPGR